MTAQIFLLEQRIIASYVCSLNVIALYCLVICLQLKCDSSSLLGGY